jgi:hypothetical protein
LTSGLSDARARYDALFTRRLPTTCTLEGTASIMTCPNAPPERYVAPSGTRPRRTVETPVTGLTPNDGAVIRSG